MNTYIKGLFFISMLVLLSGCRKDDLEPALPSTLDGDARHLVGEWEWRSTSIWEHFFGIPEELYPIDFIYADSVNYTHTIKIDDKGSVAYYKNGIQEQKYYVTINYVKLDSFDNFEWVDFKLNLNNDPEFSFKSKIYLTDTIDYLRQYNGYPDPKIDPSLAGYINLFYRK